MDAGNASLGFDEHSFEVLHLVFELEGFVFRTVELFLELLVKTFEGPVFSESVVEGVDNGIAFRIFSLLIIRRWDVILA